MALGQFARWSVANYTGKNATDFDQPYFEIEGNEGDNNTNAQTGQFIRHGDGRFAIVAAGATVAAPKVVPNVEFVDAAPLFRFKVGLNAGRVGWVSGNAAHTLSVRVASLAY